MKFSKWLNKAEKKLESAGIGTARLDALVLAEDITGKDRAYLLAHPEFDVKGLSFHILEQQIKKRQDHEPLAFIRGKTEFYGREFIINRNVLEPRPESETMIELLKNLTNTQQLMADSLLVDVGTGSGALAITAKLEIPEAKVSAIDIDPRCLVIAKKNARKHSVDIVFHQGNLIDPVSPLLTKRSVLLCNLPYVPDHYQINQAAGNEPRIAIFGGPDGLDLYRHLFSQIDNLKQKPQFILTESLPFQHADLAQIAKKSDYKQTNEDDFIQLFEL